VLLSEILHLCSVLLLLLNPGCVFLTAHHSLVPEGRGTTEGLGGGPAEEWQERAKASGAESRQLLHS
jgi:hypothetical protein